jgi:hypothetical protein
MSSIDWDDGEPDWSALADKMAAEARPAPAALAKRATGARLPAHVAWRVGKAVVGGLAIGLAGDLLGTSASLAFHVALPPFATCLSLGVALAVVGQVVRKAAKAAIRPPEESREARWSHVGEVSKAAWSVSVQSAKSTALGVGSLALRPLSAGLAFGAQKAPGGWIARAHARLEDWDVETKAVDAMASLRATRLDQAVLDGGDGAWLLAQKAIQAGELEDAATAFINAPFDPRWPIGDADEHAPFDVALSRAVQNASLDPDDAAFVQEVAALAFALRESIELKASLRAGSAPFSPPPGSPSLSAVAAASRPSDGLEHMSETSSPATAPARRPSRRL